MSPYCFTFFLATRRVYPVQSCGYVKTTMLVPSAERLGDRPMAKYKVTDKALLTIEVEVLETHLPVARQALGTLHKWCRGICFAAICLATALAFYNTGYAV